MNKPKYEIGQKVWAIYKKDAEEWTIKGIVKMIDEKEWLYLFKECFLNPDGVIESKIYPDKESFIKSL